MHSAAHARALRPSRVSIHALSDLDPRRDSPLRRGVDHRPPCGARAALAALLATLACSSLPGVDPDAAERACAATTGRAWCDGRCVTPADDVAHCGACGRACGAGVSCVEGRCARRFVELSMRFHHTCAREADGAVWCWGSNASGQVGDGEEALAQPRPTRVPDVTATRLFAGMDDTCARAPDDTLRCWGANAGAQLGTGEASRRSTVPVTARGATRTAAMALGAAFSCAADDDGATLCWGSNEWGGLGDGRSGARPPVAPRGLAAVTQLGAGWGHVCALSDGAVWCWGSRGFAQLGDGVMTPITGVRTTPARVLTVPTTTLLVGNTRACALADDGAVWCWGDNVYGVPMPTDADRRWVPERVADLDATALYGGFGTFFARRRDGTLVGWGQNDHGQLGVEGRPTEPVAVLASLASRVTQIISGEVHSCALLTDQTVRCWGGNALGELGNGTTGPDVRDPASPVW